MFRSRCLSGRGFGQRRRRSSLSNYEQMRTAAVLPNTSQWTKVDLLKLYMCSIIILQCIDISNGRILKSFTSIPALYFSYRVFVHENKLPLVFCSITTPLSLYWLLEAIATFVTLDLADIVLYVALKVCLIEVLRVKIAEKYKSDHELTDKVVSIVHKAHPCSKMVMDVTQSEASEMEKSTIYHTIQPPSHNSLKTVTNTVSMEISTESTSRSATYSPNSNDRNETKSLLQSISTCRTQGDSSGSKALQSAKAHDRGDWRAKHIERLFASTFTSGEARDAKMDLQEEYDGVADEGDLITNPMFKVEFAKSESNRSKRLTMSNISERKVMYKIRSNLWKTLSALPTAGVLGAGAQDQIEISIADGFDKSGKVEIAYVYVDDAIEQFNRRTYSASQKKTHCLNVVFH